MSTIELPEDQVQGFLSFLKAQTKSREGIRPYPDELELYGVVQLSENEQARLQKETYNGYSSVCLVGYWIPPKSKEYRPVPGRTITLTKESAKQLGELLINADLPSIP